LQLVLILVQQEQKGKVWRKMLDKKFLLEWVRKKPVGVEQILEERRSMIQKLLVEEKRSCGDYHREEYLQAL